MVVGVKEAEVALEVSPEPLKVTGEPTWVPSPQTAGRMVGPHSVKVTVPPGTPAWVLPVTVAVSVMDPPMRMEPEPESLVDCCVTVVEDAGVTVKHSVAWTSPVTLSDEPR